MTDAPALEATRPRCLTCSEPHEQDQQYCLECGARLPLAPVGARETPLWAWATVVSLAMVAIVSGIIVALLASSGDGEIVQVADVPQAAQPASEVPATPAPTPIEPPVTVPLEGTNEPTASSDPPAGPSSDLPVDPAAPDSADAPLSAGDLLPGEPSPFDPSSPPGDDSPGVLNPLPPSVPPQLDPGEFEQPAPLPVPPPPPPPAGALEGWPAATDGFTVILASIPESRGRAEADSRAARAEAAGLDEVGVLFSSSYGSLREGYWVTFTGIHDTLNAARTELAPARAAGFPTAYTRRVAR